MIRFAELQRLDALAGVIERPHQADCRSCAERIDPCQLPPVVGPRLGPPRRACLACQRLESPEHPFCKPGALAFHPALELFRLAQEESVKERPAVQRDRGRLVAALQGFVEQAYVAADDGGVEPQLGGAEEQIGGVQVAAQGVAGLLQQVAPVRGVALGPQVCDELVATDALLRGGEEGEEGESLPLGCGPSHRGAVDRD